MSNDFIRELTRSPSHASLSAQDLEDLAKKASAMYLGQDTPLNDAVVKVASAHPGISQEQVKRVVEMANTSTFQRLFEKQAGDRNIEFTIADPSEVLRRMNTGASAPVLKVASADYASRPPRHQAADLEADFALAQMFGVAPDPTENMVKAGMIDPARGQAALELFARKEQAAKAQKKVIETLMQPPQAVSAPSPDQLGLGQPAQASPPPQMAPKPELVPGLPKMGMMGQGYAEGGNEPGMAPIMDEGGVVPDDGGDDLHTDVKALPGEIVINPEEEGLTAEEIFNAITAAKELKAEGEGELGEITAPPEEALPEEPAEQLKEAMAYVKSGRPDAHLIQRDLERFMSLNSVKVAARRNMQQYPGANPHGELLRTHQMLEKRAEDLISAIEENEHHWKMATAELGHHVLQHVLGGGNMGEVAHLMGGMASEDQVKVAMENIMPTLHRRLPEWELPKLAAELIHYEMEKSASARMVNPEHPIAQAFAGVLKLAQTHDDLKAVEAELIPLYEETSKLVSQAVLTRVN